MQAVLQLREHLLQRRTDSNNAAASERMGAKFTISAKMPAPINIEASATMANAKIVPSVMGKQSANFQGGMGSSY